MLYTLRGHPTLYNTVYDDQKQDQTKTMTIQGLSIYFTVARYNMSPEIYTLSKCQHNCPK